MLRLFLSAGKPRRVVVLALPVFLTTALILILSARYLYHSNLGVPGHHRIDTGNHELSHWWTEFFDRLSTTRVTAHAVKIDGKPDFTNWKPETAASVPRPELFKLSEDDQVKFYQSHGSFVHQLPLFASHLPFEANTTGIVTTAGAGNFGQAISLVLMMRRTGSKLPIQIILDSLTPWMGLVCSRIMPQFDAKCVLLGKEWESGSLNQPLPKFERFQWKVIAIIASTFQNVLFLDADCLPVRNPDPIFEEGSEPFTSTGLITYPDFWTSTVSPLFYKIAGDLEVPPVASRPTSESGIMVFDKARHADTLLLAAYYNYNGPDHYYLMLSQHGAGEGDKETFFQAALVLDALRRKGVYRPPTGWMKPGAGVRKGYWDVKLLPFVLGRSEPKGKWTGMYMKQVDPMEDYRAVMAAIEKAKQPTPPTNTETKPSPQSRRGKRTARAEEDAFLTDSSFLATTANLTIEHDQSRIMFFHHNGVKLDFTHINDPKSRIVATDEEGRYLRLWEDPGWIIRDFGRDAEKVLWEDSMAIYCRPELAGFKQLRDVCTRMRDIYVKLYV
jgi:alpha 1,2-mannosyltransferase